MNCVDFYDADGVLQCVCVPNVTHLTAVETELTAIHLSGGQTIMAARPYTDVQDVLGLTGRRGGALWKPKA